MSKLIFCFKNNGLRCFNSVTYGAHLLGREGRALKLKAKKAFVSNSFNFYFYIGKNKVN